MDLVIGLVGPCKSGKSVLREGLITFGYRVKHIAQEHSFAPKMWKIIGKPDMLIFLQVSYENTIKRGKLNWTKEEYSKQLKRLEHASKNADLSIDTNNINKLEVLEIVLAFIKKY